MSYFRTRKSFGPRISLTERQEASLAKRLNAAGLTCFVDQCSTGSIYIEIGLPQWDTNIHGEWFHDLEGGCSTDVAKIRLSGHAEGIRCDSTHNVVGSKSECMASLKEWIGKLIAEHGPRGLAIIADGPPVEARRV